MQRYFRTSFIQILPQALKSVIQANTGSKHLVFKYIDFYNTVLDSKETYYKEKIENIEVK